MTHQLPVEKGWCAMPRPLCALCPLQESRGYCPGRGGVQGRARLCGWGHRDTIAGLPVPPSGGQEMLRGHPSPRPGCCWAQQTFPKPLPPPCQTSLPPATTPMAHTALQEASVFCPLSSHTCSSRALEIAQSTATGGTEESTPGAVCSLTTSSTVLSSHWVSILHGVSTETWSETHSFRA